VVDEVPSPAETLQWLFEVVSIPTSPDTGQLQRRSLTRDELTERLHTLLGLSRASCRALLARIRAGESVTRVELDAVATSFDAPLSIFSGHPALVAQAQDAVLTRALEDCRVMSYRVCRVSVLVGRRRLEVLHQAVTHQLAELSDETATKPTSTWKYNARRSGGGAMSVNRAMSKAEMRVLCQRLLRDLDLALPVTPPALCRALEEVRGRRIKLIAAELGTVTSVGHLTCKANRDLIAFHSSASTGQQAHVIYHEVMHLVRGHLSGTDSLTCGALEPAENLDRIVEEAHEDATLYTAWQEREAELGATILSELSRHRPAPRHLARDAGQPERNIAAAFGLT
jgi:hypothetical protein